MSIKSQLELISAKAMKNGLEVTKNSVKHLGTSIIAGSPVDKGDFKNGWNTDIGTISYGVSKGGDGSGNAAISELEFEAEKMTVGDSLYFNNPLPYGPRLEYDSWSAQAPDGMVRINTARWGSIVALEAAKLL